MSRGNDPVPLAADRPLPPARTDRVVVQLGDGADHTRIHVSVRGGAVRTRIVAADAELGRRLEAASAELHGALARRGFQETHVVVNGAPASADAAGWTSAIATAALSRDDAGGSGTSPRHERDQSRAERDPHRSPERDPAHADGRPRHQGRSPQRSPRERER